MAATARSASTRDPAHYGPDNLLTPTVVARTGPDALADGELSCDGVNEDGTPEEGYEDDGDTLNDFIHHNSWRPDARQFKSRKANELTKKGVRPGETVLITEEDIWSRATQGTTKGGCETQGSFQTWQVKQLKATGEDQSTVKPLDSYTTEFNELIEGDDVEGMDLIPTNGFCSSHYFDEHDGLVATAWYEQGTRLLDVRDPKNIKEVGYFMAPDSVVWAAYWSRTDPSIIYVMDHQRGIDVLRVTSRATGRQEGPRPRSPEVVPRGQALAGSPQRAAGAPASALRLRVPRPLDGLVVERRARGRATPATAVAATARRSRAAWPASGSSARPYCALDRAPDAEVADRQDVRTAEVEDQEHVGRPLAEALDGRELRGDLLVGELGQPVELELAASPRARRASAGSATFGRDSPAARTSSGSAASSSAGVGVCAAEQCRQPVVDRARRLRRELLPDDRADERAVGVARPAAAALLLVERPVLVDEPAHHGVRAAQLLQRVGHRARAYARIRLRGMRLVTYDAGEGARAG